MRTLQAMILGLGLAAAAAWAQVASEPSKPAPAKTDEVKKAPAPKKAQPKKAQPKKASTPPAPVSKDPNVKVFKAGSKDAPKLRDKDGNVIPTSPDAYDVSSATRK